MGLFQVVYLFVLETSFILLSIITFSGIFFKEINHHFILPIY